MFVFSLLSFTTTTDLLAQQDSIRSMLTCRHWLISRWDLMAQKENDPVYYLTYFSKKEEIYDPYLNGWGLMLDRNGTFNELSYRICGMGRKPGSGFWSVQSDTLKLRFTQNRTDVLQFKIVRLTYKTLGLRKL